MENIIIIDANGKYVMGFYKFIFQKIRRKILIMLEII